MQIFRTVAAATTLILCSAVAHADVVDGLFVHANAGMSHTSANYGPRDDKSDHSLGFLLGYRWSLADTYAMGIEAGYSRLGNFGSSDISPQTLPLGGTGTSVTFPAGSSWRLRARATLLGATMKWNVSGPWTILAHAGALHSRATVDEEFDFSGLSRTRHTVTTHGGIYAGIGFGYDVTTHLTFALNADAYKIKLENGFVVGQHTSYIRTLGASVEYRL